MTATDSDKQAQLARSKKYHIAVKDGGAVTKPGKWKDVPDDKWGDPVNYSYPMPDKNHADNAASRWGDENNRGQYSSAEQKIVGDRIAARQKHFGEKPDDKEESRNKQDTTESVLSHPTSPLAKSKIATLKTCFLEDNAISLNGRQYPREAVDKLIQSAQLELSKSDGNVLTCYISHEAADHDDSLKLAGRLVGVWREGTKAMAEIDIANTQAGRDAAALSVGGYLKTQSLRASNAELRREKDNPWPVVGGEHLTLEGIDFTATPGIQVARIQNVALAESTPVGPQTLHEVFNAHAHDLTEQKEVPMSDTDDTLTEMDQGGNTAGGYQPTSGEAPYMTNDPTQDSYGQRMYKTPELTTPGAMQGMQSAPALMEAHDRIAMVQNRSCMPARESARWKTAFASLNETERTSITERGKALSAKNDLHLDAAHDALAKHMSMACEGVNNKHVDPDQDDDTNDNQNNMESTTKKGTHPMSKEEALRLLEAEGYDVRLERKKTEAELLQEQMEVLKAEQAKQLDEMRKLITESQFARTETPQRRSQVLGANVGDAPARQIPLRGRYLQEQINKLDWNNLADPTSPLPEHIPLDLLTKEFEHYYAVLYDNEHNMITAKM